ERERQSRGRDAAAHDEGVEGALHGIGERDAAREQKAVDVPAAQRDTKAAPHDKADERKQDEYAEKARFLRDDGEDEVALGKGKKAVFLAGTEQTDAEKSAVGKPVQRLDELIPLVTRGRPRIEERREPLQAVRFHQDERG